MIIINGTVRAASLSKDVCIQIEDYILKNYSTISPKIFELYEYRNIGSEYLQGDHRFNPEYWQHSEMIVLVLGSYYTYPPPIFLNWLMLLTKEQMQCVFKGKQVFIVSCQDGNLNEIPVQNTRQLLQKVFHYNEIEGKVCTKFAMIKKEQINDSRLLECLSEYLPALK